MLALDRVGKTYPNGVHALERISAEIEPGEIVAIIGGSGCGKSTLLRAVAGLDRAERGHGRRSTAIAITAPHAKIGIIFQEPRLLPWLSVADNIGFGLADLPDGGARRTVARALDARRPCRQGQCLAARTVRRTGAARRDRARAGAAARSAAARRAVLGARCLHPRATCRIICSTCGPTRGRRWCWSRMTSTRPWCWPIACW